MVFAGTEWQLEQEKLVLTPPSTQEVCTQEIKDLKERWPTKCKHFRDGSRPEGPMTQEVNVHLTSRKLLSIPGTLKVQSESHWGKTEFFCFVFVF